MNEFIYIFLFGIQCFLKYISNIFLVIIAVTDPAQTFRQICARNKKREYEFIVYPYPRNSKAFLLPIITLRCNKKR